MDVRINKVPLIKFNGDIESVSRDYQRILFVFSLLAIVSATLLHPVFGVKAFLIFAVSLLVSKESEIFFLTQKMGISRSESLEMLKTTRPATTGLIFALLLPVGTPLFVVAAGAFVSIFVGKMIFGGYSFNVFNPAIVGRLFVGISWPALVTVSFPQIVDNYILQLVFKSDVSGILLSPLELIKESGVIVFEGVPSFISLFLSPQYGMLFSVPVGVYVLVMVAFFIRKTIDFKPFVYSLVSTIVVVSVVMQAFNLGFDFVWFHLMSGGFLFVTLFMMTDPFTKPITTLATLYYSVLFAIAFTLIRFLGTGADGVLYALLFCNVFVPLLNKKNGKKSIGWNWKTTGIFIVLFLALLGTGFFITKVLDERVVDTAQVVSFNA